MTIPERPTPGTDPAEGRDDLDLPGADRPDEPTYPPTGDGKGGRGDTPESDRRDELAERVGSERPSPAGGDRPDLIGGPDIPEGQM